MPLAPPDKLPEVPIAGGATVTGAGTTDGRPPLPEEASNGFLVGLSGVTLYAGKLEVFGTR